MKLKERKGDRGFIGKNKGNDNYMRKRKGTDGLTSIEREELFKNTLRKNRIITQDEGYGDYNPSYNERMACVRRVSQEDIFERKQVMQISKKTGKLVNRIYILKGVSEDEINNYIEDKFVKGNYISLKPENQIKKRNYEENPITKEEYADYIPDLLYKKLVSMTITKEQYHTYKSLRKKGVLRREISKILGIDRLNLINGVLNYEKGMNV